MRKWFFVVFLGFVLGGILIWALRAPLISSYLSRQMRIPISLEGIALGRNGVSIEGFEIKNPKGFRLKSALLIQQAEVIPFAKNKDLFGFFSNPLVIEEIALKDMFVSVEFPKGLKGGNNWTVLGKKMPKSKSRKRVLIQKLVIENLRVEILGVSPLGKPMVKEVGRLEFYNIDSEEGFPTEELVRKIFGGSGIQQFLQDAFNPQKQIQNLLNPFRIF